MINIVWFSFKELVLKRKTKLFIELMRQRRVSKRLVCINTKWSFIKRRIGQSSLWFIFVFTRSLLL